MLPRFLMFRVLIWALETKSVRFVSCMILEGSKNIFAFCCLSSSSIYVYQFVLQYVFLYFVLLFVWCMRRKVKATPKIVLVHAEPHHNLMGKDIKENQLREGYMQ
jgi:hypothetical protein